MDPPRSTRTGSRSAWRPGFAPIITSSWSWRPLLVVITARNLSTVSVAVFGVLNVSSALLVAPIVTAGPATWVQAMSRTVSPPLRLGQARTELSLSGRAAWSARTVTKLPMGGADTAMEALALAVLPSAMRTSARSRTVPPMDGSNATVLLRAASRVTAGPLTWVQLTSASVPLQASAVAPAALPASTLVSATTCTRQPAGAPGTGCAAGTDAPATAPPDPPPPQEASNAPARTTPDARANNVDSFKISFLLSLQQPQS
jgi:hypothetical protein